MGSDAPYGSESMSEKQMREMHESFKEHDRMLISTGSTIQYSDLYKDPSTAATMRKIKKAGDMANEEDSLLGRIKEFTKQSVSRSSWLRTYKVPEKAAIDSEMSKAEETFGVRGISRSQRTKRGKKFKDKAKLQAKMVSEVKFSSWLREDAMYQMMDKERTYAHSRDFFDNAAGADPEMALMMRDMSHYYAQNEIDLYDEEDKSIKEFTTKRQMDTLEMMASKDKKTRNKALERIFKDFLELDLSRFDYKSDKEFVSGKGKDSFAKRYAALRAYSHIREMLSRAREGSDYPTLKAKADTIQEILADYDRRALFLQSPYYALLAGKDVDSFSDEELRKRIGKTEDPYVKAYMEKMLESRENFGFAKGMKAEDIMKEYLNPEKRTKRVEKEKKERAKDQEKKRKKEINEQEARKKILIAAADDYSEPVRFSTGDTGYLTTTPPALFNLKGRKTTKKALEERILKLHKKASELNMDYRRYENMVPKWELANGILYARLVYEQQRLNETGLKVAGLNELKVKVESEGSVNIKGKDFNTKEEIDELINELTGTEEYAGLLDSYLKDLSDMETALIGY